MPSFQHKSTRVVVTVDEATAATLGPEWEPRRKASPTPAAPATAPTPTAKRTPKGK